MTAKAVTLVSIVGAVQALAKRKLDVRIVGVVLQRLPQAAYAVVETA